MSVWTKEELTAARRKYGIEPDGTPSTPLQYRARIKELGVAAPDPARFTPWAQTWDEYCVVPEKGLYEQLRAGRQALLVLAVIAAQHRRGHDLTLPTDNLAKWLGRYDIEYPPISAGLLVRLRHSHPDIQQEVIALGVKLAGAHTPQEIAAANMDRYRQRRLCGRAAMMVVVLSYVGEGVTSAPRATRWRQVYNRFRYRDQSHR